MSGVWGELDLREWKWQGVVHLLTFTGGGGRDDNDH